MTATLDAPTLRYQANALVRKLDYEIGRAIMAAHYGGKS